MPPVADAGDHRADRLHHHRREAERGLVEHEQCRPGHERAADREHLLLAAGQLPGELLLPLVEDGEDLEHARGVLPDAGASLPDKSTEFEVLEHRHVRPDLALLGAMGDAEPDDQVGGGA